MSNNKINELFLLTQKAKKYESQHNEMKALEIYLEIYHDYNSKISSTYESTIRLLEKNKRYKEAQEVCIDAIKKIDNKEISGYRKTFVQKLNRIDKKIEAQEGETSSQEIEEQKQFSSTKRKFTIKKIYSKKREAPQENNKIEDSPEKTLSLKNDSNTPGVNHPNEKPETIQDQPNHTAEKTKKQLEEEELDRLKDEVEQVIHNFSLKHNQSNQKNDKEHSYESNNNYTKKQSVENNDSHDQTHHDHPLHNQSNKENEKHNTSPRSTKSDKHMKYERTDQVQDNTDENNHTFFWKRKYTIRLFCVCLLLAFFIISFGEKSYNNLIVNLEGKEALEGADEIFDKDKVLEDKNEEIIEYVITEEMMALTKNALEQYYDVEAVTFTLDGQELGMGIKMIPSSSEEVSKDKIVEGLTILSGLAASEYKDLQGPDSESLGSIYNYYNLTLASIVTKDDYLAKGTKAKEATTINWLPPGTTILPNSEDIIDFQVDDADPSINE